MLAFAHADRGDDSAVLVLHRLPITEDRDGAGGAHASIERHESRPAEEYDKEQKRDHETRADFGARVSGFAVHRLQCDDFAHAAFSAALGPVRRATTSAAGPIIFGRPSSSTSSRSAAASTPR